jgi:hypothetical protein
MSITWNGVQRRDSLHAGHVPKRDQLADAGAGADLVDQGFV